MVSLVETTLVGFAEILSEEEIILYLITIYDKADVGNIPDKELKDLIQNIKLD